MEIKSGLGFLKLWLLALVVSHHQSLGIHNISPIAKEVKEYISEISDCHVHILYDELDLNGPILNPSVTIWKTNASHDAALRAGVDLRFRHDITRVKGINCVYAIVFLASQTKVYYKRNPSSGSGPPVNFYFNRVISYAFYILRDCFWRDSSISLQYRESYRKLSSNSYVLFFTRLREYQWLQILESGANLLSFSSRIGLRFFSVLQAFAPETKSKAYFQCSFCQNDIPLLIPMKKAEQGDINLFNAFARNFQHKVLKVAEDIDSINYEWYTNDLNVNLLSKTRAFDSPKLFYGLFKELSSTKRGHELFILNTLAKNKNATVIICPADWNTNRMCGRYQFNNSFRHSLIFLPNNDKLGMPMEFQFQGFIDTVESSFIVVGVEGHKFLTCYHEQRISFRFYMSPFQRDLWIILAFTTLLLAALLHIFIVKFHKSKILKFSPYLFILSTIIDDNCAMPGGLARELVIRIAFGPWFLMTVVLVNAYIGLVITGLTSPLPKESVDSFSKLTKMHFYPEQIARGLIWSRNAYAYEPTFELINTMDEERLFALNSTREFDPDIDFKIFSSFDREDEGVAFLQMMSKPGIKPHYPQAIYRELKNLLAFSKFLLLIYELSLNSEDILYRKMMDSNLSIELRRELLKNATIPTMEDAILLNLIVPEHMSIPTSYINCKWNYSFASAVEEEIVKCGRSAYADIKSVVDLEHEYLKKHYPWIKFSLSKEEISKKMDSWAFPSMPDKTPIFEGMKALLFTGIYQKLEEYFLKVPYLDRQLYTTTSEYYNLESGQGKPPLSLADSIQTAFILFGSAVSVSILTLACESLWYYKKILGSKIAMVMHKFLSLSRGMFALLYGVLSNYVPDMVILASFSRLIRRIHKPNIFERHG
jgi:hypothetical protein